MITNGAKCKITVPDKDKLKTEDSLPRIVHLEGAYPLRSVESAHGVDQVLDDADARPTATLWESGH